jgi:putative CocE/NonD family hydrolase
MMKVRLAFVVVAALLLSSSCRYFVARAILPRETRPATHRVEIERRVAVRTPDGVTLVADVFHPVTTQRTPTILVRVPFTNTRTNRAALEVVGKYWASRGYHVVIQGTRGRYLSSGRFYPLEFEREDGLATLAWLARQPWFDGRLGMWGGSVFAHTQWALADQKNPGPSALVIQIASTEFHQMFYPGGAFSLESALFWAIRSGVLGDRMPAQKLLARGYAGFPLIEADDRAARDVDFFNDWVLHDKRDAYWARISGENRTRTLAAPALLMAGWYDAFLPSQLEDYRRIKTEAAQHVARETRLIIGPWSHAYNVTLPGGVKTRSYRQESFVPTIAWFDRHLRHDSAAEVFAPVRLFVMGPNVWRDEQEWPLARTVYTPFYLRSGGNANTAFGDGVLSPSQPGAEPPDRFTYDPRDPVPSVGGTMLGLRAGPREQDATNSRRDVLVYTTPSLERDVEVTGPVVLYLYVATTARNTDFTAKLVDVYPDGRAYNVSEGILRRSYEGHDAPMEIRIEMWPTSNVFRSGHRIRLDVSSSNYPRFDRNPNTGAVIATETRTLSAHQTVFHGAGAPSRLILPIIPH